MWCIFQSTASQRCRGRGKSCSCEFSLLLLGLSCGLLREYVVPRIEREMCWRSQCDSARYGAEEKIILVKSCCTPWMSLESSFR